MTPVVRSIQSRRAAAARHTRHRIYADPRWKVARRIVLDRDPTCTVCGLRASTIADHHPTPLATLLAAGHDPFDVDQCRGVCHHCSGHADGAGGYGGAGPDPSGHTNTPAAARTDFSYRRFPQ